MNYITHVNSLIRSKVYEKSPLVLFGQNIAAGSCIGGLTKGLKSDDTHFVLNTPNCENTLVGTGFGLMLSGVSSIFFMKQQDFLLLGIDQLVNTYNIIRCRKTNSSFTIVNVIVDSGYEGPQSSLNNFYDFCSVARIQGYAISNKHDCEAIIERHLISPGFRIIGISQRLCRQELLYVEGEVSGDKNGEIFQYSNGNDLTVVCFNYSFPQGLALSNNLKKHHINTSLFSVNAMLPVEWKKILDNVKRTNKLVVLDDSKSINSPAQHFIIAAQERINPENLLYLYRKNEDLILGPNPDQFTVDDGAVMTRLGFTSK